jgi:NADH-quinone oxidoreductase subunit L
VFGLAALVGAGVTAFYMSRLFFMTFHGRRALAEDAHPHESPPLMTVPMIVLASGPPASARARRQRRRFVHWLEPVDRPAREAEPVLAPPSPDPHARCRPRRRRLAWRMYWRRRCPRSAPRGSLADPAPPAATCSRTTSTRPCFMRPGQYLTRSLVFVDNRGVDGAVRGLAAFVGGLAGRPGAGRPASSARTPVDARRRVVLSVGVLVVRI